MRITTRAGVEERADPALDIEHKVIDVFPLEPIGIKFWHFRLKTRRVDDDVRSALFCRRVGGLMRTGRTEQGRRYHKCLEGKKQVFE
jgi:hypothetical protein